MRHDKIRDFNAELQHDMCKDLVIEPALILLDNEQITGTDADCVAHDVSSQGQWSTFEQTFLDN